MPEAIDPLMPAPVEPARPEAPRQPQSAGLPAEKPFAEFLKDAVGEVNKVQVDAERAIEDLLSGKRDDMARVMLAVQKADLAFETMMQIRNKLLDAYQEIMRMRT